MINTLDNGKVRAVAKGVRKTKSQFGARLEPMSHVRLLLYRGRELDIVSQAESIEPLSPMLSSLDRASQGIAAIEAVDQLSLEREPNPRLYRMLVGVLRTIAERPSPRQRVGVLLEAARRRGDASLSSTPACGAARPSPTSSSSRSTSPRVACCAAPADRACRSAPAALALMRDILGGRLNEALAREESPVTHEVGSLATRALEHHIERHLRAVAMFERH